jgi:hypothetical protein
VTYGHERTGGRPASPPALTRREVLATSGALALGGVLSGTPEDASVSSEDSTPVLAAGDLVQSDAYVEWQVNAEMSALVEHLRATVDAFEGAGSAATAFVSTGADGIPQYVESATFADADAWPAVGEQTAAWFAERHGTAATAERREADVGAWTFAAGDGTLDAVRLDKVDDRVVLTIVGGENAAALDPLTAARQYAAVVRGRIGGR